jgi:iron complex outermembrane recepter protein
MHGRKRLADKLTERKMSTFRMILTIALCGAAMPAFAQTAPSSEPGKQTANQGANQGDEQTGDIVVTATRRSEALSDIPLAVSAVTAQSLANSGASDIRALNQLSPSLLVSSTSSEAAAGGARIRGIGTVGDNPGLESSVATFVDGVYRSRAGVGLTELGALDRIEVLRGPQGTLFGRNASAGLVSVITAKPSFNLGATGEVTYGNFDAIRLSAGITGPLSETIAARVDGVYFKRDGFLLDTVSGRRINNRDRWLLRGQLLFQPNDSLSVRIIGDYANRKEECCGATFLPAQNVVRATDGSLTFSANSVAGIERALGATINDNTFNRVTSITPGVSYKSDVKDWGGSGEINYDLGGANLTSITAYRDWSLVRGQDADYNNLDILRRLTTDGGQTQSFQTFTQELRLQGTAWDEKLDWLIGGYYADEKLNFSDNLTYGADYERFANCLLISSVLPSALAPAPTGNCISVPVVQGTIAQLNLLPTTDPRRANIPVLGALIANPARPGFGSLAAAVGLPTFSFTNVGQRDTYRQSSRNYAFFTHNVIKFTDVLSLTLGARYTNERKTLDATLTDNNTFCRAIAATPLAAFAQLPCVVPSTPTGTLTQNGRVKAEDQFTGTAVLSLKPTDGLLMYGSYSRGYKSGGFNLDRAGLARQVISPTLVGPLTTASDTQGLTFEPEIVNAFEVGVKLNKPGFDLNIAAFYQKFQGFQLNTFNGLNFIVVNVDRCKASLNGADKDLSNTTGACTAGTKPGVISKGVEIEAFIRPTRYVGVNLGMTYTDTRYGTDLVGVGGAAFPGALFQLPGSRLSNSSEYVATGSFSWSPPIGNSGLSGLVYVDTRLQSDTNTGSDLDIEKVQDAFAVTNARIGLRGAEQKWALEFWAQNVFNVNYQQVTFDAPLQGGGTTRQTAAFGSATNQIFGGFLAEPRTYGLTARIKF